MATLPELLKSTVELGGSDLHLTTNTPPQVRVNGKLDRLPLTDLTPAETKQLAYSVLTDAQKKRFEETLELDFSFGIKGMARFRCNMFNQRGAVAAVYRLIPERIRSFEELNLPKVLTTLADRPRGLVLVTGPTGSGKSTTLAAMLDKINSERQEHILTIEDPIEYIHPHKRCLVNQREVHSDTQSFTMALRAALRQAPKVILVGEMRDRETIEIALTAAETGHLVFSTLHTIDASKTVDRIVGTFEAGDQQAVRTRLAACFRYFISQRLVPKKTGGRVAVLEVLKSTMRTREYIERGDGEGKSLLDAMRDGELDGMQYFDGELEKLVRGGIVTAKTAYLYATNSGNLRVQLADVGADDEDSLIIR